MVLFIHICFLFIWIMYYGLIATPITLFIPFSLKIQKLVGEKKYLLSTFISLIPVGIFYFSNASSYELYIDILILFIAIIPLFILTYFILYLLGFLNFYLSPKFYNSTIPNAIFYLLYLSYMTVIYFSSNEVVKILYNFLFRVLYISL